MLLQEWLKNKGWREGPEDVLSASGCEEGGVLWLPGAVRRPPRTRGGGLPEKRKESRRKEERGEAEAQDPLSVPTVKGLSGLETDIPGHHGLPEEGANGGNGGVGSHDPAQPRVGRSHQIDAVFGRPHSRLPEELPGSAGVSEPGVIGDHGQESSLSQILSGERGVEGFIANQGGHLSRPLRQGKEDGAIARGHVAGDPGHGTKPSEEGGQREKLSEGNEVALVVGRDDLSPGGIENGGVGEGEPHRRVGIRAFSDGPGEQRNVGGPGGGECRGEKGREPGPQTVVDDGEGRFRPDEQSGAFAHTLAREGKVPGEGLPEGLRRPLPVRGDVSLDEGDRQGRGVIGPVFQGQSPEEPEGQESRRKKKPEGFPGSPGPGEAGKGKASTVVFSPGRPKAPGELRDPLSLPPPPE